MLCTIISRRINGTRNFLSVDFFKNYFQMKCIRYLDLIQSSIKQVPFHLHFRSSLAESLYQVNETQPNTEYFSNVC